VHVRGQKELLPTPCEPCSTQRGLPVIHKGLCPRMSPHGRVRGRRQCRCCGRTDEMFVRFLSCRRAVYGHFEQDGFAYEPVEGAKVRLHVDYCSAFCYTNSERGHWERKRQGRTRRRRRATAKWMADKGPNPRGKAAGATQAMKAGTL